MIKIAAFIVPKKNIRKKIILIKKQVKKEFGNQPYLNHPPHCTLFTMNVIKNIISNKKIRYPIKIKNKSKVKSNVTILKTGLFNSDPLTGGKTIFFKIKKNVFLNDIQMVLLKKFKPYLVKKKNIFKFNWMKKNNDLYGYPFVSKKWIPHFTIASLMNINQKNKFIKTFLNMKICLTEPVNAISFYKVKNDKHIYLWSVKINYK